MIVDDPDRQPTRSPATSLADEKERILADFRDWLDALSGQELAECTGAPAAEERVPDLFSFLSELAALRRDVQLQGRSNQALRHDVKDLTSEFAENAGNQLKELSDALAEVKRRVPDAQREARAEAALELAGVCEGLARCLSSMRGRTAPWLARRARRQAFVEELQKPLELVLGKADDAVRRLGLRPVAAVGDAFCSHRMRATETTGSDPRSPGTVVEIIRQGYTLDGVLLQAADVKVTQ